MWPDRVSNPGPLALESDALSKALRGPAKVKIKRWEVQVSVNLLATPPLFYPYTLGASICQIRTVK